MEALLKRQVEWIDELVFERGSHAVRLPARPNGQVIPSVYLVQRQDG